MARRRIDRAAAKAAVLRELVAGRGLVAACEAAGVHVATVCRWRHTDPEFGAAVRAEQTRLPVLTLPPPRPVLPPLSLSVYDMLRWGREKPTVPVHPDCPACGATAEVVKCGYTHERNVPVPFWRCTRWPRCQWASWRPRHPLGCTVCNGPRFWADSRKSVHCPRCDLRAPAAPPMPWN